MKNLAIGTLVLGLFPFSLLSQDEVYAQAESELLSRVAPSVAYGPGDHHWHYVGVDKNVFVVMDSHRVVQGEGASYRQVPVVVFMADRSEHDGVPADYVVMLLENDCTSHGKFRGLVAAAYTSDGTSPTVEASGELDEGWQTTTQGAMPVVWEWACQQAPKHQAMPDNMSFDEMLSNYRDALSWSSSGLK